MRRYSPSLLCSLLFLGSFFLEPVALLGINEQLSPTPSAVAQPLLAPFQEKPDDPSSSTPQASTGPLAPYTILLTEKKEQQPPPAWALQPALINEKESLVEIPLPALSTPTVIENFTLTVDFEDMGDGGPRVEWKKSNGDHITLCSGLAMNGAPIGLNSRTIQVPYELALDGGTLLINHAGRFQRIISVTVRPGRSLMIAAPGEKTLPTIVDESLHVIEKEAADGASSLSLKKEDSVDGSMVTAVLSQKIDQFEKSDKENEERAIPFQIELKKRPQATILRLELQGLDLTSHVDVELNGTLVGTLSTPYFRLDAPEFVVRKTLPASATTFEFAGWQEAHLFIPSYLWKKNNELVLILKKGPQAIPSKVHLRNSLLELRY